jgi:hypothetical protein
MRSGVRLFATFLLLVPFVAAACGGDDEPGTGSSRAGAGAGGSQPAAGTGGGAARGGKGGSGEAGNFGDLTGNGGAADACVPVGGNTNSVLEPLGDACSRFNCPASVADAVKKTLDYCGNTFPPRVSYGCGKVTVDYADFSGGPSYTFDSATNEVVLIRTGSDTPFGQCHANEYDYGELDDPCPDDVTCYPCDDLRNDSQAGAGAAGELGSAGDTGAGGISGAGGDGSGPRAPHCPNF